MDDQTSRLECLKLATGYASTYPPGMQPRELPSDDKVLEIAKKWAGFVIGDPVKSSANFGKKGRDDPK